MREIKFRAWDTVNKVWRDIEELIIGKNNAVVAIKDTNGNIYQVHEGQIVLMQYTGLKDKNGEEIYEGDFIRRFIEDEKAEKQREQVFEIVWNNEYAEFEPLFHETGWRPVLKYVLESDCDVIGNIYENPELLKNGQ